MELKASDHVLKHCSKCDSRTMMPVKAGFCSICATIVSEVPQETEDLQAILNTKIKVGPLIFQRQDEKFVFRTTAKEARELMPHIHYHAAQKNEDMTFEVNDRINTPIYAVKSRTIEYLTGPVRELVKVESFVRMSVEHSYIQADEDDETIEHLVATLAANSITNPVCRKNVFYVSSVDCWRETQPEDTKVELRILYNQIQQYMLPTSLLPYDQAAAGNWPQWLHIGKLWEEIRDIFTGKGIASIQNMKHRLDAMLNDNAIYIVPTSSEAETYKKWFGCEFKLAPNNPKLKPVRSDPVTPEDKALRDALARIKQDIYYSKRKQKIYSLKQVQAMFDKELEVYVLDPTFKAHCKHMKICNVNVYVFNSEIDALFTTADFRASQADIAKLVVIASILGPMSMRLLLGYQDVRGTPAYLPEESPALVLAEPRAPEIVHERVLSPMHSPMHLPMMPPEPPSTRPEPPATKKRGWFKSCFSSAN